MHRTRSLLALGAILTLLAPTTVVAQPDDGSPITRVGEAELIVSDGRDAFAILMRAPGVATDPGLTITRTDRSQLPPPLDQTPSDATIYRIDAQTDPGRFAYGRLQVSGDLSFVEGGETPAILRVAIGSGEPTFLGDQRILRLPPPCRDGSFLAADCLSSEARDLVLLRSLRDALDLLAAPDIPSVGDNDLLTLGSFDGPGTIVGFGGGIAVDSAVELADPRADEVASGDSSEVRATQTIAELFGGAAGDTTVEVLSYDPAAGGFEPVDGPPITVGPDGTTIPCQPGLSGLFLLETSVTGAGRNLPQALGPGFESLAAGTDILITTVHPFVCPLRPIDSVAGRPVTDPAVALVCVRGRSNHTEYETRVGRRDVVFPTTGDLEGAVAIFGLPGGVLAGSAPLPDPFRLDVTIAGANRDRPIRTDLDLGDGSSFWVGFDTWDSAPDRDVSAQETWQQLIDTPPDMNEAAVAVARFDFKAGVDGTGRKRVRKAVVRIGDKRADITDQFVDSLGTDRLRVRFPQEDTWGGDCALPPDGGPLAQPPYLPVILE